MATAKQIIIVTGGPATLSGSGHIRMQALEDRLQALEADLPFLSLTALLGELDAALGELLAIAQQEVVRIDGGPPDAEIVAVGRLERPVQPVFQCPSAGTSE